jgi:pimeloyl-ACP methyl ester carboxylesterase
MTAAWSKRGRRLALAGVGLAAAAAAIGLWGLERGWMELPLEELEARYRLPESRFVDIDGVRVHYADTGSGAPLVLLHASYLSLRSWDAIAAILDREFRVIRLDLSGAGLTGYDPELRYGIERNIEFVSGLLDHLGIGSAALVGTSSGGIVAFRFAAGHPERVSRLVLINSAGMPRTAATNPLRPPARGLPGWIEARWRSRRFWARSLAENFVPPHLPADELVEMTYDMNRRRGWREIAAVYLASFRTGDPQEVLGRVRAPTLVQWGLDNRTLMHLEADVFAHWLTSTSAVVRKYPGLGHYAYIEDPATLARDIVNFLSGAMEVQSAVAPSQLPDATEHPPVLARQ